MSEKKVSFGRIFWPSFLAVTLVAGVIFLVVFLLISSLFPEKEEYKVENNTVLHMTLEGAIAENSTVKLNPLTLHVDESIGLADILFGLEEAKKDSEISGVYLEVDNLSCGYATASEIRKAIIDFQSEGKFVYAYNKGEAITLKEYYLSTAAKTNYGFPSSMMEFGGIGAELMYYKNTLDQLNIEMQVIRGKNNDFKSAVEPYFRTNMSDSSRLQTQTFLNGIWNQVKIEIAAARNIDIDLLDKIADSTLIRRAADAVNFKLLDAVKYRDEILIELAEKVNAKKLEDLNLADFKVYAKKKFYNNQSVARIRKSNVAVILGEGAVATDGEGFTSKKIVKHFRDVRLNNDIKTVVFRVNSPGGSALASDEIWREVELTAKIKNVIVSMGDVAASGGYYVAAPATKIFAEPNTITGSIGVFGVIPYTGDMFENKLGITFDRVKTNPHSVLSLNKKLTPFEFNVIQEEVNAIYDQFLQRVADGRNMTTDEVNVIARGRVWTGADALKIGLVDELGGLTDAINYAVKEANIENPIIEYFPEKKIEPWEEILETLDKEQENNSSSLQAIPEELIKTYNTLKDLESRSGVQARAPEFLLK